MISGSTHALQTGYSLQGENLQSNSASKGHINAWQPADNRSTHLKKTAQTVWYSDSGKRNSGAIPASVPHQYYLEHYQKMPYLIR